MSNEQVSENFDQHEEPALYPRTRTVTYEWVFPSDYVDCISVEPNREGGIEGAEC